MAKLTLSLQTWQKNNVPENGIKKYLEFESLCRLESGCGEYCIPLLTQAVAGLYQSFDVPLGGEYKRVSVC